MEYSQSTIFSVYPFQEAVLANIYIDKLFIQKRISNPKIEAIVKDLESCGIAHSNVIENIME